MTDRGSERKRATETGGIVILKDGETMTVDWTDLIKNSRTVVETLFDYCSFDLSGADKDDIVLTKGRDYREEKDDEEKESNGVGLPALLLRKR